MTRPSQAQYSEGPATVQSFPLTIREMRSEDARAFLEVHHRAVRELAADSYPSDVIEAWAPLPITKEDVQVVCSNAEQKFRLVAELNGEIIGIGCLFLQNNELRACSVLPAASRRGVGSAVLREIERLAYDRGSKTPLAESSLNAELFCRSNGYEVRGHAEHVFEQRGPDGVRQNAERSRSALAV